MQSAMDEEEEDQEFFVVERWVYQVTDRLYHIPVQGVNFLSISSCDEPSLTYLINHTMF